MKPLTKIPKSVKNGPDDYVSFTVKGRKHINVACFWQAMTFLGKNRITVEPKHVRGVRSTPTRYLDWMNLCKEHGLIHPRIKATVEKGKPTLVVPAKGVERDMVYIALCCYRWADSNAVMVWQILQHMKKIKGITFWQVLHFSLATQCTIGYGHSFTPISKYATGLYSKCEAHDLAQSIAMGYFVRATSEQRKKWHKLPNIYNKVYTNEAVKHLGYALGGHKSEKKVVGDYGYKYERMVSVPLLYIEKMEDLLTPKFTPMYEIEKPTKTKLHKLYKAIMK